MLREILSLCDEGEFLKADGFDDAVIGFENSSNRLIYSVKKCIEILVALGMEEGDAYDYFYFNVQGAWLGEKTPIWCKDDL